MGLPVGYIVKLVGPDRTIGFGLRQFFSQATGIAHKIVGVAIGGGGHGHQFGPRQSQHIHLFTALGFGDHNHRFEPHRGPDQRQADAGIACRAFNNRAAGQQITTRDGVLDNIQRRAVLDRLAGVHEFGFAQNFTARGLAGRVQADQRGVADRLFQIFANVQTACLFVTYSMSMQATMGIQAPLRSRSRFLASQLAANTSGRLLASPESTNSMSRSKLRIWL